MSSAPRVREECFRKKPHRGGGEAFGIADATVYDLIAVPIDASADVSERDVVDHFDFELVEHERS